MKINCDVIQDLLPLYAENMASQGSRDLVEEHLEECETCKQELGQIMKPGIKISMKDVDQVKGFARKFRKHTINIAVMSVFITVSIISLISGLFFLKPGDEIGYVILYLYLLLPFTSLVCSLFLGTRATVLKYLAPIIFGIFGSLVPTIVFHYFSWFALSFGFIPSLFGLTIGHIIYLCKKKR